MANIGTVVQIADSNGLQMANPQGSLKASAIPSQLFYYAWDTSTLDVTNTWNAPTTAGSGAIVNSLTNSVLQSGTANPGYAFLRSQATFKPVNPAWLYVETGINIEFPVLTNAYRFWGLATIPATPTAAAPLTNACGFEVGLNGQMSAVTYQSGTRVLIQNLSQASGNGKQPQDSNVHIYILNYRGDNIYWCIDNPNNVVATTTTGAPGPDVNILPFSFLTVTNTTPPSSSANIQINTAFVGDSSNSISKLVDSTYPWRGMQINADGSLVMGTLAGANTVANPTFTSLVLFGSTLSQNNPLPVVPTASPLGGAKTTLIAAGTAANTVIKASAGVFYGVFASTTAAGAGLIYDNASTNSGTPVGVAPSAIGFDQGVPAIGVNCVNGITVAGSATNPALTIYWI